MRGNRGVTGRVYVSAVDVYEYISFRILQCFNRYLTDVQYQIGTLGSELKEVLLAEENDETSITDPISPRTPCPGRKSKYDETKQ